MGFFSKKTYVCKKCGKEFQTRKTLWGDIVCDSCLVKEYELKSKLRDKIGGYEKYHNSVFYRDYAVAELQKIEEHRDKLLAKFKNDNGITIDELYIASGNYKKLSDREAADIMNRSLDSQVRLHYGAATNGRFFCPTSYDGMIVDAEDVFAVGYTTNPDILLDKQELIMCAVFTKDPYVPVFTIAFVADKEMFGFAKSKKGRENVEIFFNINCLNLEYPVCDIKQLKKLVKQEGIVKGNVDIKFMLENIDNAINGSGIFAKQHMDAGMPGTTKVMLEQNGYVTDEDVARILQFDKKSQRNFWTQYMHL